MNQFDHILNWKLKVGSHPFPGKDGGTCINEAAIVAAGFKYRPVLSVKDMPECFSRPICKFAMRLNDQASDAERQRLLPFVTRLACADTAEVEAKRAAFIKANSKTASSFDAELKVLEGALAIGRQANPLADVAMARLEQVQARAAEATSKADRLLFAKVQSWFERKKNPEFS